MADQREIKVTINWNTNDWWFHWNRDTSNRPVFHIYFSVNGLKSFYELNLFIIMMNHVKVGDKSTKSKGVIIKFY